MSKAIAFSTPGSASSGGGGSLLGSAKSVGMDMASMATGGLVDFAPSLQKAELVLYEPPPGGDVSQPMGKVLKTVKFMFNPKDLSFTKNATWTLDQKPSSPTLMTFGGSGPATLNVEVFLDATDDMGDRVVNIVETLMMTCVPTEKSLEGAPATPSGPWVVFRWGGFQGFPAVVTSVNGKFTLFTPDGIPVRATCTLALKEITGAVPKQNPTSGARTATNLHLLVDGDTLASVAYEHYGSANMWRAIAEANDIDDPMRLPVGTALLVPALRAVQRG